MKITIEKFTDLIGYHWIIRDKKGREIRFYAREVSQIKEDREGGFTYQELLAKIKEQHSDWEI